MDEISRKLVISKTKFRISVHFLENHSQVQYHTKWKFDIIKNYIETKKTTQNQTHKQLQS